MISLEIENTILKDISPLSIEVGLNDSRNYLLYKSDSNNYSILKLNEISNIKLTTKEI